MEKMELASDNHNNSDYDYAKELKKFIETKVGVKGLVDSGITKVPRMFIQPAPDQHLMPAGSHDLQIPTIDLKGLEIDSQRRKQIMNEIRDAAGSWGFFQLINHDVPVTVIDNVLEGVRQFHEQPKEVKMEFYHSAEKMKSVSFFSNRVSNKSSVAANWKDSLVCNYVDQLDEEEIPPVCRKEIRDYTKYVFELKDTLAELLSEALGLRHDYLSSIKCMGSASFLGSYYPTCPEPNLVLGTALHSDAFFLTILAQDSVGGLQVLLQNQFVDVPYVEGALVVNIADMMQLVSNNKFKSVLHRVRAGNIKSRVSAACFFSPSSDKLESPYGPPKELISEESPAIYREVCVSEFIPKFFANGFGTNSALRHFELPREEK
jgi:isopenicillin N synthase-like dioxygenase